MNNVNELETIKQFFTNTVVKDCVSIKKVEEISGLPKRTLYAFIRGDKYRYLTKEQIAKLVPVIEKIGYKSE